MGKLSGYANTKANSRTHTMRTSKAAKVEVARLELEAAALAYAHDNNFSFELEVILHTSARNFAKAVQP
jgi:hypothetical protein